MLRYNSFPILEQYEMRPVKIGIISPTKVSVGECLQWNLPPRNDKTPLSPLSSPTDLPKREINGGLQAKNPATGKYSPSYQQPTATVAECLRWDSTVPPVKTIRNKREITSQSHLFIRSSPMKSSSPLRPPWNPSNRINYNKLNRNNLVPVSTKNKERTRRSAESNNNNQQKKDSVINEPNETSVDEDTKIQNKDNEEENPC